MPEVISDADKKLKIKLGVLQRCTKEIEMYKREADTQSTKIASLEASGACPHDIKKQREVLTETMQIIPDCERRLECAKADLSKMLTSGEALDDELRAQAFTLLE